MEKYTKISIAKLSRFNAWLAPFLEDIKTHFLEKKKIDYFYLQISIINTLPSEFSQAKKIKINKNKNKKQTHDPFAHRTATFW